MTKIYVAIQDEMSTNINLKAILQIVILQIVTVRRKNYGGLAIASADDGAPLSPEDDTTYEHETALINDKVDDKIQGILNEISELGGMIASTDEEDGKVTFEESPIDTYDDSNKVDGDEKDLPNEMNYHGNNEIDDDEEDYKVNVEELPNDTINDDCNESHED